MKRIIIFLGLFFILLDAKAQDFYKHVDRVIWVVNDIDANRTMWQGLGFDQFVDHGQNELRETNGNNDNRTIHATILSANLGGLHVSWIMPKEKDNIFGKFLETNGEGVMALLYRIEDPMMYSKEINRIQNKGIPILQSCRIETDETPVEYTLFDTSGEGKYILGLITGPDDLGSTHANNALNMKFTQYAFVIESYEPVSNFWNEFGFPHFEITYPVVREKEYYEKEADFDMILGWQRHTDITFEWIIPTRPPTVYADHIRKFGPGVQHFGFEVNDMAPATQYMKDLGYQVSMSGGWGEKGQPGSGNFAYIDLESTGGESIELLWNYKE